VLTHSVPRFQLPLTGPLSRGRVQGFIHDIADIHRVRDSTVTMLLKVDNPEDKEEAKKRPSGSGKPKRDDDLADFIGTVEDESKDTRVVFMAPAMDLEDGVVLPKPLLKKCPNMTVHSNLVDSHFYIFAHWVLDLLDAKKSISRIKADLVPYLVRRQFQGKDCLPEGVADSISQPQDLASSMSASAQFNSSGNVTDVVRCFAYVVPESGGYCSRANTLAAYSFMNRELISRPRSALTPWGKEKGASLTRFKVGGGRMPCAHALPSRTRHPLTRSTAH
jgi:translation initiation factor eIF-2B subunit gamma